MGHSQKCERPFKYLKSFKIPCQFLQFWQWFMKIKHFKKCMGSLTSHSTVKHVISHLSVKHVKHVWHLKCFANFTIWQGVVKIKRFDQMHGFSHKGDKLLSAKHVISHLSVKYVRHNSMQTFTILTGALWKCMVSITKLISNWSVKHVKHNSIFLASFSNSDEEMWKTSPLHVY